ncbi:MAG TPA: RNA polymerase sigma factor [Candidatus Xenobia bacterium]|nr:RNA polymerase sigma factor [Candidatus Xenobia bacterium]
MGVTGEAILEAIPIARVAEDELESLVREQARFVYRVCYSVLRHHHDAEDAAQETFVRVWRNRGKLAGIHELRGWLARIAWRVALDRRRTKPELSLDEAAQAVRELRAAGATAEQLAAEKQMSALLERLIASLPRELREPLVLSTVEEMTAADVAAALEIPEASMRTRIFRARQLLREKLESALGGRS